MITFFFINFFFFACHWIFRRKVMKATVSYCTNTKKKAVFGGRVSCDRNSSSPASSGSITESLLRLVVRQNRNKKLNWFTIDYLSGLASMCCKFHRFSAIQQKIHFFNSLCFEMQRLFSVLSICTIIFCKLDKILDLKYAQQRPPCPNALSMQARLSSSLLNIICYQI